MGKNTKKGNGTSKKANATKKNEVANNNPEIVDENNVNNEVPQNESPAAPAEETKQEPKAAKKEKIDAKYIERTKQVFETAKRLTAEMNGEESDEYKAVCSTAERVVSMLETKVKSESESKKENELKRKMQKALKDGDYQGLVKLQKEMEALKGTSSSEEAPAEGEE